MPVPAILLVALIAGTAPAPDSVVVPRLSGMDLYHANRALRRLGLAAAFQQVEADTTAVPVFGVAGQVPESGAARRPGDTVVVRFNCPGMLRYWNEWVVPLLGDFANTAGFYKVQVPPRPKKVIAADYPDELRRSSFSGDALVEALVDFDGSVLAARVTKSSGHREADSAACEAALKATFSPAEDHGAPARVWFPLPFHWQFQEEKPPMGEPQKPSDQPTEP